MRLRITHTVQQECKTGFGISGGMMPALMAISIACLKLDRISLWVLLIQALLHPFKYQFQGHSSLHYREIEFEIEPLMNQIIQLVENKFQLQIWIEN